MNDIIAIIRKELAEIFGNWQSFTGVFIQTAMIIVICGGLAFTDTAVWLSPGRLAMLYGLFPASIAATFAADAFAGERERQTLPTLLATPVTDTAIFLGKVITAVGLSLVCSVLAVSVGVTTTFFAGENPLPVVGVRGFAALFGAALTFAMAATVLTITVSSRMKVARAAQQFSMFATVILGFIAAEVLQKLGLPPTWSSLAMIEATLFAGAIVLLGGCIRTFGRGQDLS